MEATRRLPLRPLGRQGLMVSAQGLGCMGMTAFYGVADPAAHEVEYMRTFAAAQNLGVSFLDTAWMYAAANGERNETLVGKAVKAFGRDKWVIATKFGVDRAKNPEQPFDSSPAAIRKQLEESLARLGVDCIDLYYQHRRDPNTPPEVVAATLKELHREGKIKYAGLSECTAEELRAAHAVFPISAIQMEYSLSTRDIEANILPTARELGVGVVAYSPLGRGILAQRFTSLEELANDDFRKKHPRFSTAHFAANADRAAKLAELAAAKGCTTAQLALAWVHAQGDDIFPIPGTRTATRLAENAAAVFIQLTAEEKALIASTVTEADGERYAGMAGTFNLREKESL